MHLYIYSLVLTFLSFKYPKRRRRRTTRVQLKIRSSCPDKKALFAEENPPVLPSPELLVPWMSDALWTHLTNHKLYSLSLLSYLPSTPHFLPFCSTSPTQPHSNLLSPSLYSLNPSPSLYFPSSPYLLSSTPSFQPLTPLFLPPTLLYFTHPTALYPHSISTLTSSIMIWWQVSIVVSNPTIFLINWLQISLVLLWYVGKNWNITGFFFLSFFYGCLDTKI